MHFWTKSLRTRPYRYGRLQDSNVDLLEFPIQVVHILLKRIAGVSELLTPTILGFLVSECSVPLDRNHRRRHYHHRPKM